MNFNDLSPEERDKEAMRIIGEGEALLHRFERLLDVPNNEIDPRITRVVNNKGFQGALAKVIYNGLPIDIEKLNRQHLLAIVGLVVCAQDSEDEREKLETLYTE